MCDCLTLTYHFIEDPDDPTTISINSTGTLNGYNTYEFTVGDTTYYIWHDNLDNWYVTTDGYGGIISVTGIKENENPCPIAEMPVWLPSGTFDVFTTVECETGCDCLNLIIQLTNESPSATFELSAAGIHNEVFYYEFTYLGTAYTLYFTSLSVWYLVTDGLGGTAMVAQYENDVLCPETTEWDLTPFLFSLRTFSCGCKKREDRIYKQYDSIKLPDIFVEQNRGLKDCCCRQLVLASNESESWKNDVTSAWIKLSANDDTYDFKLLKNNQPANYNPTVNNFVNEPNAFYTTIEWSDVLFSDGVGCYKLVIEFSLSGINGSFVWGEYELKQYSIQNALKTARVRAIFNGYQENEGIDFTASNVVSTHRFFGFIGLMQPRTEIDNLIYGNREMKRVIRENVKQYQLQTDPEDECIIRPLHELYLLSENEIFISDYNAHNHSYRYLDLPVIVEESPEIEYKELSRKASLKCVFGDKFKKSRTYYNG